MIPLALAASLLLAPVAEAAAPAAAPAPAQASPGRSLTGAPQEPYQLVAWCYGALSGYLDLYETVMPEVTRIESTWRRPGSNLADDLKVYQDQQRQGREDLKRFKAALTSAEKASVQPIAATGAEAIQRGRAVWRFGPDVKAATVAQEWMSWSLPAQCEATATQLAERSKLLGASLQSNTAPTQPSAN